MDFVVETSSEVFALEVKSGRPDRATGLATFGKRYPEAFPVVIGGEEFPLKSFFAADRKTLRRELLRIGLAARLGTPIKVSDDTGLIHFKNTSNGKSGSYSAQELDAQHILRRLQD